MELVGFLGLGKMHLKFKFVAYFVSEIALGVFDRDILLHRVLLVLLVVVFLSCSSGAFVSF